MKLQPNQKLVQPDIFINEEYELGSKHLFSLFISDKYDQRGYIGGNIIISPDANGPIITLVSPSERIEIQDESIVFRATVTDEKSDVTAVEFFLDGKPIKTFNAPPFVFEIITSEHISEAGEHTILIRAYDKYENVSKYSKTITIN